MSRLHPLLAPVVLTCALATALAFAGTASAETKFGEASSPANSTLPGESDLLRATASYDSRTGTVSFDLTTREAPGAEPEVAPVAGLVAVKGACDRSATQSGEVAYPTILVTSFFAGPESGWATEWQASEENEEEINPENFGPAVRVSSGTTTTLAATAGKAVEKPYNCAVVGVTQVGELPEEGRGEFLLFPISVPKTAEPVVKTVTVPGPVPLAVPGKLSVARSKALTAKGGKWTKLKVKISNTGGTAVGPIAIKAKSPKGVAVKPVQMKVPALLPGQTWTVNLQVKVTEKAKPKSTIRLTGTSGALTAAGSVVVKAAR